MEARRKRLEDLNITRDEINNIGNALQKEEFRKLFAEYCEEVTSPESKRQYQKEVTELEKQRGVDVTFINPEPGFVVKTSIDGERKAFINISKNGQVAKPSSSAASEEGTQGRRWSLPFSLAPPREDYDKLRNPCTVFDVVFHPETHKLAEKNSEFRKMLINTALDAVEDNCQVKLDRTNLKYPKMTYKGLPQAAVVRKKMADYQAAEQDSEIVGQIPFPSEENLWSNVQKKVTEVPKKKEPVKYTQPKYSIKYRHGVDLCDFTDDASSKLNATVPKELIITVDLPLLNSAKDLSLDVTHKSLSLQSEKPKYKLDLVLPYGVDEDAGNASFDVTSRKLQVEVPVKRATPPLTDVGREDSGVESDPGGRADEDSDEKSPSEASDNGSEGSDHQSFHELSAKGSPLINDEAPSHQGSLLQKEDVCMLPNYSWNTFDNMVAVVLHVKNVESNSIVQSILPQNRGIQLSFTSLGGGLFPQSYSFCMAFHTEVSIEPGSLTVEVWDNNLVAQFGMTPAVSPILQVLVGTGPHDLQMRDVSNLSVVEQKIAELQGSTESAKCQSPMVEVQSAGENELVLQIEPFTSKSIEEKTPETDPPCMTSETCAPSTPNHSGASTDNVEKGRRNAVRQLSECSSDDMNGKRLRGILKKRPLRSLSESNADDYALYQSASLSDESGPNSAMGSVLCIGEGESETGCETENEGTDRQSKKTVRFSDVIAKQTFRPNSSILGQRKKNQRKQRNKKRAQERRFSESENSEPESELLKGRRRASLSEGEVSNLDVKVGPKKKFLKDLSTPQVIPQSKKILRRSNSSDTDEDAKEQSTTEIGKLVDSAGDSVSKGEPSDKMLHQSDTLGDSSEDERDDKTEDKKKKKKKRKGKKVSDKGDCKIVTKQDSDFKNNLVLELEM